VLVVRSIEAQTKRMGRGRAAFCASAAVAALSAVPARADDPTPPLKASMQCERAAEPGRVRCSVDARALGSRTIAYGDVSIVQLPDFASALKGRVGPSDTTARDPTTIAWAFGLVAKRAGQGEVRARVRLVVCDNGPSGPARCSPQVVEVRALLHVGP
jgi:hypothetical protein